MNAFKKELAGMLLDDSQLSRSMGLIVSDIDYIFKNYSAQVSEQGTMTAWNMFLYDLMHSMAGDLVERCISDWQKVDEGSGNIIDLVILLNRYFADDSVQDILTDGTNEHFGKHYKKREKELLR